MVAPIQVNLRPGLCPEAQPAQTEIAGFNQAWDNFNGRYPDAEVARLEYCQWRRHRMMLGLQSYQRIAEIADDAGRNILTCCQIWSSKIQKKEEVLRQMGQIKEELKGKISPDKKQQLERRLESHQRWLMGFGIEEREFYFSQNRRAIACREEDRLLAAQITPNGVWDGYWDGYWGSYWNNYVRGNPEATARVDHCREIWKQAFVDREHHDRLAGQPSEGVDRVTFHAHCVNYFHDQMVAAHRQWMDADEPSILIAERLMPSSPLQELAERVELYRKLWKWAQFRQQQAEWRWMGVVSQTQLQTQQQRINSADRELWSLNSCWAPTPGEVAQWRRGVLFHQGPARVEAPSGAAAAAASS